jgi:hypothetical protein
MIEPASRGPAITDLASRRKGRDVLCTVTFVFGGVHYGTLPVSAPYTRGEPVALYLMPREGDDLTGPLDALVTDDITLAHHAEARELTSQC